MANIDVKVLITARDEASAALQRVGSAAQETGRNVDTFLTQNFRMAGLMAGGMIASLTALGASFAKNASFVEQNRVSFETFLGSAEKAKVLMTDISEFARKTPFDLPQVVEGSKRLMAYGIEQEKLIPTFRMLGDLASGVGTEKLPNLVMAFGQVKAATRLTGMELRQFTEAGVPMLDALVKAANAGKLSFAGMQTTVSGGSKKASVDIKEMNDKLAIAKQRLAEAQATGKAKQSTLMTLANTVENYTEKIGKASAKTAAHTTTTQMTTAAMREMIEKGKVSFDDVNVALQSLTSEGGMFFNLMDKQSKTFSGTLSNLRDTFFRFSTEVVGIAANGEIRKGSLFFYLKEGADKLLVALDTLQPKAVLFFDTLSKNQTVVIAIAGALTGLLVVAIGAAIVAFGGAIAVMGIFMAIGAAVAVSINQMVQNIKKSIDFWRSLWDSAIQKINEVWQSVQSVVERIQSWLDSHRPSIRIGIDLPDIEGAWRSLRERARKIGIPGFQVGGIVPGPIGVPMPAIVHGGERVIPDYLSGEQRRTAGGGGQVSINLYVGTYIGTKTELREFGRQIWEEIGNLARAQNKNPVELINLNP